MEPSSSDKKDAGLGTIELKILETRETSCSFIIARFEHTSKLTEIKKHSSSHQTFTDVFHFRVTRQQGDLDIEVWQKNMIFKDKLQGTLKIPLSDLLDEQAHANWYPLAKPKKAEKDEKDDEEDEEPAKEKKKKGKNAEIRLEVKFTRTEKPKEVLTGVVVQGKWTKDTSVGSIINNRDWAKKTLNSYSQSREILLLRSN
jgi:Ca2+-dependent lipid-binding protein